MRTYLFVGNRRFVLQKMLEKGLHFAAIGYVANSHLENDLKSKKLNIEPKLLKRLENKTQVLEFIKAHTFDVFVSNGCPYILPLNDLQKAIYINIHPSLLPDLRGYDPVIGAILFGRDSGATCHIIDQGVDTGDIIAQVKIKNTKDLDVTTLYQLSFYAEQEAFEEALKRDFQPQRKQISQDNLIEYRRNNADMVISFNEDNEQIIRKIKAYNNKKIGCSFVCQGHTYKVFHAEIMENPYLLHILDQFDEGQVAFSYEDSIIFKKDSQVLRFSGIVSLDGSPITLSTILFSK
ncbi:MAG: hypothetical protein IJU79_05665 [Desulfovibrionaceae bacterium]|nr:hypothetical protein [Desulfovibrionaceae bacterium]